MEEMPCSYRYLKNLRGPLVVTPAVVLVYLGISYFHPHNNQWLTDGSFSWQNFLRFLLADQLLIEFFTYLHLAWLILAYAFVFKINAVRLSAYELALYQLRFLPLFLLSFFFINPVTQSLRYGYHLLMGYAADYWTDYFYTISLYLTYLLPILLGGYALLNFNLYLNYKAYLSSRRINEIGLNRMEVADETGKTFIDLDAVTSFERIGRTTFAMIAEQQFRIKASLTDLERILNNNRFARINRAAIINLAYLKNYSFWENDKYILRLLNGKEYTVSRERIKNLRSSALLKQTN